MTHRITLSTALMASLLTAACATEDKVDPGAGGGEGSDYSGDDSEVPMDPGYGGGMDMTDPDVNVQPTYPTAHPRIYLTPNKARLQAALAANTTAASRFRTTVDNQINGANYWEFRAWNIALMGQLTGDPKYCTKAIQQVDSFVASEEPKIAAGTQPVVAGNSYLYVGDYLGDLALTYDWCFDALTASQKTRWTTYANTTLWNLWHPTEAKWGGKTIAWTGWSTNNPGDNYYYSFMRATMLVGLAMKGESPDADTWIKTFREDKILGQLVPMFDQDLLGGGSREGTAYGVSMRGLFHLYDMWHDTTGESLKSKTTHARKSMRLFVHQTMPTLDRFVDSGDQPRDATAAFFDYQRNYLQELVQMYPNDPVAPKAKTLLANSTVPQLARPETLVFDFLYDMSDVTAAPLDGMGTSLYAPGIGQVYSRSGWDRAATWLNFTAGAYSESHQHQDQGQLLIYKEGWMMADAGLGSRNGIIQDTPAHSIVRIDSGSTPVIQKVGTTSKLEALHGGDTWLYAAADLTPAYGGNSAVQKVQREVVYLKPNVIVVYDRVATASGTSQTWQLAAPGAPSISGSTTTVPGTHPMTVRRLVPASATAAVTNMTSVTSSAGSYLSGYRLDEKVAGGDQRYLHVISLDGAATSATAADDHSVTVSLSDGSTANVSFNRDAIGASLAWGSVNQTLGGGVDMLAE
ncbi:MAG TPA: hypothetical protein VL326_35940 [Kofleriaceae bacterium]|nr:hypothetical protein [Kofleriaceae bacterium]